MPLPLKLTPFERYMLADDRERHPMTFTIRLKFSGDFAAGPFAEAVAAAVERHPLLAANLDLSDPHQPLWTSADDPMPYLDIGPIDAVLEFPGSERIDLERETGLRIWVRMSDEQTEIRFQFHHSCADGIAAYRLIEDVLCAYHAAIRGDVRMAEFRPLEAKRLQWRDQFGLSRWQMWLRTLPEAWGALVGTTTFFLRRPKPLARSDRPADDPTTRLRLLDYPAISLNEQQSKCYVAAARRFGVKLNDLLIRDLLVAGNQWNQRHGLSKFHPLRIAVPVDLRTKQDELLPACDVVAMVFLDRNLAFYPSKRHLLRTIRWETAFIKRFRLALSFVRLCSFVGRIPGGMQWLAKANRCYATAVMSNMGRPLSMAPLPWSGSQLSAGGLVLEAIESAPPVRPFTAAGFTALTYNNRLTLIMNYDRFHFTAEEAEQFCVSVVRQMRRTVDQAIPAEEPAKEIVGSGA